jgi:hypothetical protein
LQPAAIINTMLPVTAVGVRHSDLRRCKVPAPTRTLTSQTAVHPWQLRHRDCTATCKLVLGHYCRSSAADGMCCNPRRLGGGGATATPLTMLHVHQSTPEPPQQTPPTVPQCHQGHIYLGIDKPHQQTRLTPRGRASHNILVRTTDHTCPSTTCEHRRAHDVQLQPLTLHHDFRSATRVHTKDAHTRAHQRCR